MTNQIEGLECAILINEQTLSFVEDRLRQNSFDRQALEVKRAALNQVEEWIAEAEQVHGNHHVANLGKIQHNKYSGQAKYIIAEIKAGALGPVKNILVVDDQYGKADDPMFSERYGNDKVQGYRFTLEDAFDGTRYSSKKVVARIRTEQRVHGILLDLDFGRQESYGEEILSDVRAHYPEIPILIHSSNNNAQTLLRCLSKGAAGSMPKVPSCATMKEVLDRYIS
ncbi:MAG: hypothetical protein Q8Q31_04790 [Nanoarchaeota archaeon]|nr:hypothetical protein [Nanoarchaeota archaeon]